MRPGVLLCSPVLLSLMSCGGGGGGGAQNQARASADLPVFTNSFATFAAPAETFTSTTRAVGFIQSTNATFAAQSVTVANANDGTGDIIVTLGATPFRLSQDPASGTYLYSDPGGSLAAEAALSDDVGVLLVVTTTPAAQTGGFHVFGRTSGDVAAQTGTAYYIGPSAYVAATDGGVVNAGSGGFLFEVDFAANLVDGRLALEDTTGTQFTLDFENAPIAGTGFTANALQQTGLSGAITDSRLSGDFFGPEAAQVGGTYQVDLNASGTNTFVSGAFVGNRQSDATIDALVAGDPVQVGGETIVLGSGSVVGGSGSVYPDGASSYYNSNTGVSFGADGGGCYYVGDWSNC